MRTGQDHELKRILDEAFRAFEAGDDANARRLCRDALALDPESGTAHSLLGLLYEREGKRHDATHEFAKVISQSPQSEAERETLARLRGLPVGGTSFGGAVQRAADRHRRRGGPPGVRRIFAAFRSVNNMLDGRAQDSPVVASVNIEADLELAREAFASGRYETALQAAGRVLKADPDNAVAREIFDRSQAFLRGTQQPPTSPPSTPPQVVGPAEPADVRTTPAVPSPRNTNPNAAAGPVGPVTPRQIVPNRGGSAAGGAPAGGLPSISAPTGGGPGAAPPRSLTAGEVLRTTARPPITGYDRTARPRSNTPGSVTPPRRPPTRPSYDLRVDDTDRAEQPKPSVGSGQNDVQVDQGDSYVKVEVTPRPRANPDQPAPEVTPGGESQPSAGAGGAAKSTNPVVEDYQERQKRLREFRERQKALESRRAEREQGQ